jgi:uncharacterized membrane protein YeaQ/YmgE (transglycosylase-associated protein family)
MGVLGWILFGFVVGLIARALMPGRDPLGLIGTTVLGIVGALAAGWIGQALGLYAPDDGGGFVAATIGAVVVLGVYYAVTGHRQMSGELGRKKYRINEPVRPVRGIASGEMPGQPLNDPDKEKDRAA